MPASQRFVLPWHRSIRTGDGPPATLWRMREFLRPYRGQLVVMVSVALAAVVCAVLVPLVIRRVVDGPLARGDRAAVAPLVLLALWLGVAEAALAFWRRWVQSTMALNAERDVRDALYQQLQALPPSFHDRWHSGQLLSRMTSDLSAIRRFVSFGLVFLVVNLAWFVAVCALLIHLDPALGLLVSASLVPVAFACARFGRQFSAVSRRLQDGQGDLATAVEEAATGIRVIKAFGRREQVSAAYRREAEQLRGVRLVMVRLRADVIAILDAIPNATLAVVLLLGAAAVGSGRLTVGELIAFVTLALQLVWPIEALGFILASAQEAATAAQRVYELLDTEPEIRPPHPDQVAERIEHNRGGASPATARIRFENVTFRYPGARTPVLRDVRLEIEAGQTLALVGASGSGKTTLAMLLPRLADVSSGRVLLDGHDVRSVPLPRLRTAVATAFEEPILFSASVRENVTLGREGATEEELHEALALAQAQFAHQLPWGLDTRVGEQGMSLSGGQRQRLALARAVLGRPEVLVLDDPLSALDVQTEALVEEALRRVLATTTALLVVHRPSTVALADRVAVLHDGAVEAVGTHAELLATSQRYADLMGEHAGTEVRA